jgi:Spy/CpxP family protein refolding chaperone
MKKRLIILSLVLTTLAAAVYAGPGMHRARGEGHGFGGGHGFPLFGHLREISRELDLSEAQKEQIHAIMRESREQNKQYREQLHGGFTSVARLLIENPNNVAGAQALLDQQAAAERALKQNMLASASRALNVLTPQQRTKLAQVIARHEAKRDRK